MTETPYQHNLKIINETQPRLDELLDTMEGGVEEGIMSIAELMTSMAESLRRDPSGGAGNMMAVTAVHRLLMLRLEAKL